MKLHWLTARLHADEISTEKVSCQSDSRISQVYVLCGPLFYHSLLFTSLPVSTRISFGFWIYLHDICMHAVILYTALLSHSKLACSQNQSSQVTFRASEWTKRVVMKALCSQTYAYQHFTLLFRRSQKWNLLISLFTLCIPGLFWFPCFFNLFLVSCFFFWFPCFFNLS